MKRTKVELGEATRGTSTAAKVALGILGASFVAGISLIVGMDMVMKKVFVNESWPDEEWSSDEWAEEDLE